MDKYKPDEKGRVLELMVGTQLVRTNQNLYYWREGSFEVDYVLQKGRTIWAIEVKSNDSQSIKGLEAFKKKFPSAHLVTINLRNYIEFEENPMNFLEKFI